MRFGTIPFHASTQQLASFLRQTLAAIAVGWGKEHDLQGRHTFRAGTWTPIDLSGAGLVLTTEASHVKIGQMVYAAFQIKFPSTADGSFNLIGGLPFASEASVEQIWTSALGVTSDATNAYAFTVLTNGKRGRFISSGGTAATNAQLSTDVMQGAFLYRTPEL